MRVLIIGGTRFVGRHIAELALAGGDEVTLFHRGLTGPSLLGAAEHVHGDRHDGFDQLHGREFDAVIDTTAYHPRDVAAAAGLVGAGRYVLISTVSAYRDIVTPGSDETAPLWDLHPPLPNAARSAPEYGGLKVHCERVARERHREGCLIVRPGVVIGPHDWSGRLASWLERLRERDRVLAAERAQPIQLIDARDLAQFVLVAVERGLGGTFNAVGPATRTTMEDLLSIAASAVGSAANITWAGDTFLEDRKLVLPLWLPLADAGLFSLRSAKARAAGLVTRPLADSLRDIVACGWRQPSVSEPATLSSEVEDALLEELDRPASP